LRIYDNGFCYAVADAAAASQARIKCRGDQEIINHSQRESEREGPSIVVVVAVAVDTRSRITKNVILVIYEFFILHSRIIKSMKLIIKHE